MDTLGVEQAEADHLRTKYWEQYGTTLAGLMAEHNVDPDGYLHEVHEISMHPLNPDHKLAQQIKSLPGRKIVYTNGSEPYARRVLAARGLDGVFEAVYGVEHAAFRPKPEQQAFEMVFGKARIDPMIAAMFEDEPRNLKAPHAMGMRTVHVAPDPKPEPHIHHHTSDLSDFLSQLVAETGCAD
ncbi:MAG: pyrimidine 5'-nucleotidase, partial [Pseudomonadota bacterium]